MAKLAYCETCKATYPLAIVSGDIGRAKDKVRDKPLTCPFGHTDVREVDDVQLGGKS